MNQIESNKTAEASVLKSRNEIIEELINRTAKDPVFKAICERFAKRERTRVTLTIHSLKQSMKKEGLEFERVDYEKVLRFLAFLGIGKLDFNLHGNLRSLKDIKWKLQDIGKTALSVEQPAFKEKKELEDKKPKIKRLLKIVHGRTEPGAILTVTIKGQKFNFPIPRSITEEELGYMLASLYQNPYKKSED